MLTADELLAGSRYRDVEVTRCTDRVLHAVVDGESVEVELPEDLAVEVHAVWRDDTTRLRVAQADPMSMPVPDGEGGVTHPETGWLVVSNPRVERARLGIAALMSAAPPAGYAPGLTAEEIAHFPNLCRLIDDTSPDGGQSSSRNGASVNALQLHHMAWPGGRAALDGYSRMVSERAREVSSNLGVGGGRVRRIVNLMRRAWTSGSASMDAQAITVETANVSGAPDWRVSDEDKTLLGRIAAALRLDLAWQSLVDRIYRHRDMYPRWGVSYQTSCPVDITVDDIVRRAETGSVPEIVEDEDMSRPMIAMKLDKGPQHGLGVLIEPDGAVVGLSKDQWGFWEGFAGVKPIRCTVSGQWEYLMGVAAARRARAKVGLDEGTIRAIAESVGVKVQGATAAQIADELAKRLAG